MSTEKIFLPNTKTYQSPPEEDEMFWFFPEKIDQKEYHEGFNMENPYFLSRIPSKEFEQSNELEQNKSQIKNENNNSLMLLDDFEFFYNKFADKKDVNEMDLDREEYKSPCFDIYSEIDKRLSYSIAEDKEILRINTENNEPKGKKDKLFNVKIFKIIKKRKSKKIIDRIKMRQNKLSKKNSRKKNKNRNLIQINKKDELFPFTAGKGIILYSKIKKESLTPGIGGNPNNDNYSSLNGSSTNEKDIDPPGDDGESKIKIHQKGNKKGNFKMSKEEFKENRTNESIDYSENLYKITDNFFYKFTTKKYFVAENGKKKRVKKKRKFKPDDIRKKIKARFHKTIKNIINENLKKAGSKELFDFLPQCFIGNVSKKTNSKCFDLTYKELLSTNFIEELNKGNYRNSKVDLNKYKKNIEVLEYLDKNPEICRKSGFDLIKDRKYKDLLVFYFSSAQFENSVIQLKEEKESPEYIQEYIYRARSYVSFYANVALEEENKKGINNTKEDEEKEDDKRKEEGDKNEKDEKIIVKKYDNLKKEDDTINK